MIVVKETVMHFEIHKEGSSRLTSLRNAGGDWRWELHNDDGEVIGRGDGYASKAACRSAVEMVKMVDQKTLVIDRPD
jgi:uncharacterized protein YegP (UPF0339 family)